jgi:hypothetical protein
MVQDIEILKPLYFGNGARHSTRGRICMAWAGRLFMVLLYPGAGTVMI